MTHVLVLDNFDSFVYTLNGYLRRLGATTEVFRADAFTVRQLPELLERFDAVLVSPGPGTPVDAGVSIPLVLEAICRDVPLLGVCLGHQAIAEALGGTVCHADELMHGKTSRVTHFGDSLFADVPRVFSATRYHSLAVARDDLPAELTVTAETADGVIMALRHKSAPVWGVQYHPESVLTEGGYMQLANWLAGCGLSTARDVARGLEPLLGQ